MTTTFLRDCSHYDSDTSLAGFAGCTHKLTEGRTYIDPAYAGRLPGMRATNRVLGSYHVLHTGNLADQLAFWVAQQDKLTPWWRDWPHWVMQVDAEKWPGDPVTLPEGSEHVGPLHLVRHLLPPDQHAELLAMRISTTVAFAGMLVGAGLPGWNVTYASRGQYGNSLQGIATPLWNAAYHSSTYPGDGAADWAPYSGKAPTLWQYTSTPYDKSAFRGSLDELLTLIGGTDPMSTLSDDKVVNWLDPRIEAIANLYDNLARGTAQGTAVPVVALLKRLDAAAKAGTSITLSDAQYADLKAALVAAQPSAADVAAHVDVQGLAAALAAHIKVS